MKHYLYTWRVEFYGSGNFKRHRFIEASTRADALRILRETERVVLEVICCVRADKW